VNTATVDTAMDQKYKPLFICISVLLYSNSTLAQVPSPSGSADKAIEGLDTKEKRGLTFLPGVRSSISYSDNISLKSDGTQTSGFRLEASPYVFASVNNDQGIGQAYLSLRNFYQSSSPSGFYTNRIDFRGNGTLNIYDNWLFLTGTGFAYNVNPLTFGPIAFEAATVPTFNNRLQGFTLAPYIAGSWGSLADYRGQYSYGTSAITGFISQRIDQSVSGSVNSGSRFNSWGWAWQGQSSERKLSTSPVAYGRNIATATLYAIPMQGLRLGAAVRYEQIDNLFNKNAKDYGIGPGASIDWSPTSRTLLRGSAYKQYYGTTGQLGFSHRWDRLSFNLNYDKSVISGNDASFLGINPQDLQSTGVNAVNVNPIYRTLVADSLYSTYGVPLGLGVVNDAFVLRNGGTASLSYTLSSGFISLSATSVTRDTLIKTFDPLLGGVNVTGTAVPANGTFIGLVKSRGLTLDWEYKLDSRSKWRTQVSYSDNDFPSVLRTLQRRSYQTTYSTKVTSDTTASLGLRRVEQTGTGYRSINYDENTVFSTLDVRF
jgi:uncharacterized protein (PEP-CTERM system associated)